MPTNSEVEKLKSEYPEFFAQFSSELLELIFSEKTSSKITEICLASGIEDEEKIEKIAYRVTLALLGQVPKENLTEIFEKGAGLDHETAEKISVMMEERIFPPPQPSGTQLLKELIKKPPSTKPKVVLSPEPPPKAEEKKDTYREPIE
jgi:hypothetical protein